MRSRVLFVALGLACATLPVPADDPVQSDWSGGPGVNGPVQAWGSTFAAAEDVSWQSVGGRLALATEPRTASQRRTIGSGFAGALKVLGADVDGDGAVDMLVTSWELNQVAWWRLGDFVGEGQLTSSILEASGPGCWRVCSWEEEVPAGTELSVEARAADDPVALGEWLPISGGGDCSALDPSGAFLQYRLRLSTSDEERSPKLYSMSFSCSDRNLSPRRAGGRIGRP